MTQKLSYLIAFFISLFSAVLCVYLGGLEGALLNSILALLWGVCYLCKSK